MLRICQTSAKSIVFIIKITQAFHRYFCKSQPNYEKCSSSILLPIHD